jgi:hypothetical protein
VHARLEGTGCDATAISLGSLSPLTLVSAAEAGQLPNPITFVCNVLPASNYTEYRIGFAAVDGTMFTASGNSSLASLTLKKTTMFQGDGCEVLSAQVEHTTVQASVRCHDVTPGCQLVGDFRVEGCSNN